MNINGKAMPLGELLNWLGYKGSEELNLYIVTLPITHTLKCWPKYFQSMRNGHKRFDLRNISDRMFHIGQYIMQREWDDHKKRYTGLWDVYYVQYILSPNEVSEFVNQDVDAAILDLIHVIGN